MAFRFSSMWLVTRCQGCDRTYILGENPDLTRESEHYKNIGDE